MQYHLAVRAVLEGGVSALAPAERASFGQSVWTHQRITPLPWCGCPGTQRQVHVINMRDTVVFLRRLTY